MEIPTRDINHTCSKCKKEFKEYLYWKNCGSCNDGTTEEGYSCLWCAGHGKREEWVTDQCEHCLIEYIEEQW